MIQCLKFKEPQKSNQEGGEDLCLEQVVANRSRVLVLVFVNWNLYKMNLCRFSSQRVRGFWPWLIAYMLCLLSIYVLA